MRQTEVCPTPTEANLSRTTKSSTGASQLHKAGKKDTTGISVDRAKYQSLEEAAKGHPGKTYFVALLRAGDLRKQGIQVVSRPEAQEPGHAELPGLNYENRKSDQVLVWKKLLAHELVIRVEGPFPP
jgi:hypothetical protein